MLLSISNNPPSCSLLHLLVKEPRERVNYYNSAAICFRKQKLKTALKKVHEAFVAIVGLKPLEGDLESPD
jgi:hypothetical protein